MNVKTMAAAMCMGLLCLGTQAFADTVRIDTLPSAGYIDPTTTGIYNYGIGGNAVGSVVIPVASPVTYDVNGTPTDVVATPAACDINNDLVTPTGLVSPMSYDVNGNLLTTGAIAATPVGYDLNGSLIFADSTGRIISRSTVINDAGLCAPVAQVADTCDSCAPMVQQTTSTCAPLASQTQVSEETLPPVHISRAVTTTKRVSSAVTVARPRTMVRRHTTIRRSMCNSSRVSAQVMVPKCGMNTRVGQMCTL